MSQAEIVAAKGGGGKTAALSKAEELIRDAQAESRIPDSAKQPTLNDVEAPPLNVVKAPRLRR